MSFVIVERPAEGIAIIRLNRPERMNAMAFDLMIPLRELIEELSVDNSVRVVILTGTGAGFCSGADLEDPGTIPHIDGLGLPSIARRSMGLLEEVTHALRRMNQPVIAAINGAAIGGGFCLSLSADIRVAAQDAYFRAAGINNGLTASELGLSYLLPRAIGQSRAAEIMLTGRDVDAFEAERIGLVSSVTAPEDSLNASSLEGHMEAEGLGQLFIRLTTQNFEEAIRARRDKRPPVFEA